MVDREPAAEDQPEHIHVAQPLVVFFDRLPVAACFGGLHREGAAAGAVLQPVVEFVLTELEASAVGVAALLDFHPLFRPCESPGGR